MGGQVTSIWTAATAAAAARRASRWAARRASSAAASTAAAAVRCARICACSSTLGPAARGLLPAQRAGTLGRCGVPASHASAAAPYRASMATTLGPAHGGRRAPTLRAMGTRDRARGAPARGLSAAFETR